MTNTIYCELTWAFLKRKRKKRMSLFFLETQKTKPWVGILDVHKKEIMVSIHKIKMSKKEEQKNIDVYLQQGERQENT
jgi:hypothetical protein